jgi:hypothetical protein
MSDVVTARWWTPGPPAGPLVGAVLCRDAVTDELKAYIGVGIGDSEDADIRLIADWGAKVDPVLGKALFPAQSFLRWADDA